MPEEKKIISTCECYGCTEDRIKRGGLAREWPLIFYGILLIFASFALLAVAACAAFGPFGTLTLPAGFLAIARAAVWLCRRMRYSPQLRNAFLWPGFGLMALGWLGLSWHAGVAAHESLRADRESLLASAKEQHEQDVRAYHKRPGWYRLVVAEPSPPLVLNETFIDVFCLVLVLLSLVSPLLAYLLLFREESGTETKNSANKGDAA